MCLPQMTGYSSTGEKHITMSITRHHNEWLSLVPNSGPFLSLPVLAQVFPQGLHAHDVEHARRLRHAFDEFDADPSLHRAWVKFVLGETLGFEELLAEGQAIPQTLKSEVAEYGETLRPDWIVNDPATKKGRLLVQAYPRSQSLTKPVAASRWKTSPDTRMMQLLHDTGIRLGIVTNGDHWMLVNAPKNETTGYASWYANLWLEEPVTLRAFRTLLGADRFFSVPEDETLEALLDRSAADQQEVTDQLGYQVRKAVEVLIQAVDKADKVHHGKLLKGVEEKVLYESALTVMMRLVFLFCAEERELLLLGDELYDKNYAVSTLREQLEVAKSEHTEEILGLRYDAWLRLISTFRAVYAGVQHDRLRLPAYGGSLFNPDRFPFLEGRLPGTSWKDTEATPLPVSNRTVLHLLEALQVLRVRLPGGGTAEARKLSFRSLDIEQIGHVYEGLLDHTANRATEPVLGLQGTRDKEPEIPLAELEKWAAKGEKELLKYLKDETGRSESALKKGLKAEIDDQRASRFRTVCQDSALWKRVQPFAGLMRLDTEEYPVVITPGSVFVTAGTDRRSSGTHYTPRSLTEPIVQYTLEPLVYAGPAEGWPKDQWKLKSAQELLSLKICDMACGSGAFLVQACRYMAIRLQEAWAQEEATAQVGSQGKLFAKETAASKSTVRITPYGLVSTGKLYEQLVPLDPDERQTYALRIVAQRCLYGVDKNPLAVEMAKLSLWLLTLAKDKPFEFLDHAIRCGDSLVGIHNVDQLRQFDLRAGSGVELPAANIRLTYLDVRIKEAITLRRQITEMQANTVEDVERQDRLLQEANEKIDRLKYTADLLISAAFVPGSSSDKEVARDEAAIKVEKHINHSDLPTFRREAQKALDGQTPFHWPLEFPEALVEKNGFDAFVCNPPFIGNKFWGERLPVGFNSWASHLLGGKVGKIDYAVLFLRRAFSLIASHSNCGFISTRAVHEGESRAVGLGVITSIGVVYRANTQLPWPGSAGVHVSLVWFSRNAQTASFVLDGCIVEAITAELSAGETTVDPMPLESCLRAFQGSHNGQGEALTLAPKDDWYATLKTAGSPFLRPFVTSDDITSIGLNDLPRWIVDCEDLPLDEVKRRCQTSWNFLLKVVKPTRTSEILKPYNGLIDRWWQLWNHRAPLYRKLRKRELCLVLPFVAKHAFVAEVPTTWVFTNKLCVVERETDNIHAVLLSNLFEAWIRRYGGTMGKTRMTLSLAAGVFTFPIPDANVPDVVKLIDGWRIAFAQAEVKYGEAYTNVWNAFHDKEDLSETIITLRSARSRIDRGVVAAYGMGEVDLTCSFIERSEGLRYTISEPARREVLARLLKLNHERYAEEVKQGLHDKKKPKATKGKKAPKANPQQAQPLFREEEDT
jgi:hypothetical protein